MVIVPKGNILDHSNKGQIPETLALDSAEMLMFNTVHKFIVTLNSTGSFVFISKAMDWTCLVANTF